MKINNAQALALTQALLAEKCVGVDHEGNEYGDRKNAHFLDALKVARPDLPDTFELYPHMKLPTNATEDGAPAWAHRAHEARKKLAEILRAYADGLEADDPA